MSSSNLPYGVTGVQNSAGSPGLRALSRLSISESRLFRREPPAAPPWLREHRAFSALHHKLTD
ncbi:hypothetical protein [Streptosporangium roseum]|uniref:hypothetical protein n=1 Tax=Streptosporangium roseum TaxID=2001 RepID=UPI0004CCE285|nr:hypothetical protein [Streptosporangium roseum]